MSWTQFSSVLTAMLYSVIGTSQQSQFLMLPLGKFNCPLLIYSDRLKKITWKCLSSEPQICHLCPATYNLCQMLFSCLGWDDSVMHTNIMPYVIILQLNAREAIFSGAQRGSALYQNKVWKSNPASEGSKNTPSTHDVFLFLWLWLLRKIASRRLLSSTGKHVICVCPAFLCPY